MTVDKVSVSLQADLAGAVRAAAAQAGQPLSTWLADAAAAKLRAEALATFLRSWEGEHGALSADELARARADLALPAKDSVA